MQDTEQIISLYHTGFIVCLCLAILFAALSIAFFFLFRIRQVFDFRTGRGEKRTIRQMEDENAKTGKLRQDIGVSNTTSDLYRTPTGSIPTVVYPATEKMNTGTSPTQARLERPAETFADRSVESQQPVQSGTLSQNGPAEEGSEETTLLRGNEAEGSEETTLLHRNVAEGSEETALLQPIDAGMHPGTRDHNADMQEQAAEEVKPRFSGKFEIVKESMWIHTDEKI